MSCKGYLRPVSANVSPQLIGWNKVHRGHDGGRGLIQGVRFVQLKQATAWGQLARLKHKEESEWNLDNLVFVMVKFHPSLMRE